MEESQVNSYEIQSLKIYDDVGENPRKSNEPCRFNVRRNNVIVHVATNCGIIEERELRRMDFDLPSY
jgi:hypothetical protein